MPTNYSTGFKNSLLGNASILGTRLSFGDGSGAGGLDKIMDSGAGFITAGFKPGDEVTISGAPTAGNNQAGIVIDSVADGEILIPAGTLAASESGDADTLVEGNNGGSYKVLLDGCVIEMYTGSQPASANNAEQGTLVATVTKNGGAFVAGSKTNGLVWRRVNSEYLYKLADDVWKGVAVASGIIAWARIHHYFLIKGASLNAIRVDVPVGVGSSYPINLSHTDYSVGEEIIIQSAAFKLV